MPGVGEGFVEAVVSAITGFTISVVVNALAQGLNGLGNTLILLFSLVSIIGVLELIHNMQLRSLTRALVNILRYGNLIVIS